MPRLEWTNKLNVGVYAIDAEHKNLVSLISQLHGAVLGRYGEDTIGEILDRLISDTKTHFANEERLFADTGYRNSVAHKRQHAELIEQVVALRTHFRSGATGSLPIETVDFLGNWLVDHIQDSDKTYVPHLRTEVRQGIWPPASPHAQTPKG
jgi:hemerythrin-like metal-binding protein